MLKRFASLVIEVALCCLALSDVLPLLTNDASEAVIVGRAEVPMDASAGSAGTV